MRDNYHTYTLNDKTYRIYDSGIVKEVDGENERSISVWDLVVLLDRAR